MRRRLKLIGILKIFLILFIYVFVPFRRIEYRNIG